MNSTPSSPPARHPWRAATLSAVATVASAAAIAAFAVNLTIAVAILIGGALCALVIVGLLLAFRLAASAIGETLGKPAVALAALVLLLKFSVTLALLYWLIVIVEIHPLGFVLGFALALMTLALAHAVATADDP